MFKKYLPLLTIFVLILAACQPLTTATPETGPQTLTVMTHDSFSVSEELVKKFETENNASLIFIQGGDTGSALNRLILTSVGSPTPEADIFYGLDNTFLSRALDQGISSKPTNQLHWMPYLPSLNLTLHSKWYPLTTAMSASIMTKPGLLRTISIYLVLCKI